MNNVLPHGVDQFFSTAVAPVGQVFKMGDGRIYMYVKFEDAITYASGQCVWWNDRATYTVTNDESGAEDDDILAGIVGGAPSQNDYGLIQIGGRFDNAKKTPGQDTIAPGTILIGDDVTPTDGTLYPFTGAASTAGNPTNAELLKLVKTRQGFCVASDTSNDTADTVDVDIYCYA